MMHGSPDRRRPSQLILLWLAYWAVLVAVTLREPIAALWRISQTAARGTSSASAGFTDGGLTLTIIERGATVWAGATDMLTFALWVAGPPLLLWLVWMSWRPAPPTGTLASDPLAPAQLAGADAADVERAAARRARTGARRD